MKAEKNKSIRPPRWAQRFLEWYCRPELLEDLQGDLNEYFDRNVRSKGARRARWIFVLDVLKFMRMYTLRKPRPFQFLNQWIMIGSYFKTSLRSMLRNRVFATINVVGLAISMAVGLLMIGLLSDMFSYDRFHENGSRIYRVISDYGRTGETYDNLFASTSLRTGEAIRESVPGVLKEAVMLGSFDSDMKVNDRTVPLRGMWANEFFFEVFTFPLINGDPSTALREPFSLVLTEKSAAKLFGDQDPLGKTIQQGDRSYTITGVMRDIPRFSHLQFEGLISLSTRRITEKERINDEMAWDNLWQGYVYLLLPENADLKTLQANLDALSERENKTIQNATIHLSLQPMFDIALGDELSNSLGPIMGKSSVWIVGILTGIVILSACFNYTNLSIARALRRSREVGIRKVIGALRSQVVVQFVTEAVLIALLALVVAFGLFLVAKPHFLSMDLRYNQMLSLDLSIPMVLYFIAFAGVVGIIAGFFPALFFSRISAIQVLKSTPVLRAFRHLGARKSLIVLQYTISLVFISVTLIGFKEYKRFLALDLGFKTENVLNISLYNNKSDVVIKELSQLPEVTDISRSVIVTSVGNYWGTLVKYIDPQDSANVFYNGVDEHYLPLHGHQFLAGRNFTPRANDAKQSEVIVNETLLKRFKLGDPQEALGKIITVNKEPLQIIGVLKDFRYGTATDNKLPEVLFRNEPEGARYINVKIASTDWPATLAHLEKVWHKIDEVHTLEARFYSQDIERAYSDFSSRIKVMGTLAFLAIFIASIGLFGMVIFTTETRLKEISIRKVLGASEGSLIYLLSKGFLLLLGIASAIAIPATQFFYDHVAFEGYGLESGRGLLELLTAVGSVLLVALLMISSRTMKIARTNPAQVLKSE